MLRQYCKEDIKAIIDIENNSLHSSLGEEYYLQDLNNNLARHYVYEIENKIIGFISSVYDGFTLEILNFAIRKEYQNQGIGTKLLSEFLEIFVIEGVNGVVLDVRKSNERAQHLYEKLGFKTINVRKNYYTNGEDALVLQKLYEPKEDLINILGNVYCKKEGIKYRSSFKEKHDFNYLDLYNKRIEELPLRDLPFVKIKSNWYDEVLFKDFQKETTSLMYLNIHLFKPKKTSSYEVNELNNFKAFKEFILTLDSKYGLDYASKNADFLIVNKKHNILVVNVGSKIVGTIIFVKYHACFYITHFYVLDEYQNKGYGSSLFNAAIAYFKNNKVCDIYLDTPVDGKAYQMYKEMGFKEIDRYYQLLKVYDDKN